MGSKVEGNDKEFGRTRRLSGVLRHVVRIIHISLPILGTLYILNIGPRLGLRVWVEQYLAIFMGLAFVAVFLDTPASKKEPTGRVPWYDLVLCVFSLVISGYLAIFWPEIVITGSLMTPVRIILGIISVLVVLEATRRIFGWTLVVLVSVFIVYSLFTQFFPGPFYGNPIPWKRLAVLLYMDKNSLLGITLKVVATMVLPFVLFGQLIFTSGGGQFLVDLAMSIFGRMKGAPAKVPVVASGVFGSISGVAVANVYTTGRVTIPMMIKYKIDPHVAGAIEATASTGGLILPPVMGVVAFIMTVFINKTYAEICIAAAIPAILYYVASYLQIDRYAARRGFRSLPAEEIPSLIKTIKENWYFFIPLFVLIYTLFLTTLVVELCAVYSCAVLVFVTMFVKRGQLSLPKLISALETTGKNTTDITVVCALSGFLIGVVMFTGLGFSLTRSLVILSGGHLFPLLMMTAFICILLGMGMPIVTVYIIAVTLVVPALTKVGVPEISGHMFVYYFGMLSFLTPPVMLSVYVACVISKASPWSTAWTGMRLGISAYLVPFAFIYNTSLLFEGSPLQITAAAFTALVGIGLISFALEGYLFRNLTWIQRIVFILAGVALLWPTGTVRLIGLAFGVLVLAWEWVAARRVTQNAVKDGVLGSRTDEIPLEGSK